MAFQWRAKVTAADQGRLLRDVLRDRLGISSRMLIDLKYKGCILLNGSPVTVRAKVCEGDVIDLYLAEEAEARVVAQDLPLSIVYEDEDLLVVNKPPGQIVHPIPPEPEGTLANAIAWHWKKNDVSRPVRVITRLDRDTSGLVLVAKHALAQHLLTQKPQMIDKYYLALVEGILPQREGVIDAPIAINEANPVTRLVSPTGRPAQTAYSVLRSGEISLVRARLLTGRTHQIRVHFAWLGHPIVGDQQYGHSSPLIQRQALHCHGLRLVHPRSQQEFSLLAPLPEDMERIMNE